MAGAVRAARIVIVTLLGPGIITLAIPYLLLCCGLVRLPAHLSALQYAGLVALAAGLLVACWCMAAFTLVGRGTPTSTDPPKVLVAHGLYRLERNPMYSGVLLIVFGEAACCESAALALHGALAWLALHLFVLLYEEPTLRRRFGDAYEQYCQSTPRWIPRMRL